MNTHSYIFSQLNTYKYIFSQLNTYKWVIWLIRSEWWSEFNYNNRVRFNILFSTSCQTHVRHVRMYNEITYSLCYFNTFLKIVTWLFLLFFSYSKSCKTQKGPSVFHCNILGLYYFTRSFVYSTLSWQLIK